MRIFLAAIMTAALAGPAFAQNAVPRYGEVDKDKTPQQLEEERRAERAYQRSLNNIPDKATTDPWGTVRSDNAPKPDAGAAAPKKKASHAAKQGAQ